MKWWLIEAGAELSREKVATQTVKLTLEPAMFDENGQQVELLIDTADTDEDSPVAVALAARSCWTPRTDRHSDRRSR